MDKPLYQPFISSAKNKKYSVYVKGEQSKPKLIHFGDVRYDHYKDSTGIRAYSHMNHNDDLRRLRFLKRAKAIKDKEGKPTWKDKNSANYWAVTRLW